MQWATLSAKEASVYFLMSVPGQAHFGAVAGIAKELDEAQDDMFWQEKNARGVWCGDLQILVTASAPCKSVGCVGWGLLTVRCTLSSLSLSSRVCRGSCYGYWVLVPSAGKTVAQCCPGLSQLSVSDSPQSCTFLATS